MVTRNPIALVPNSARPPGPSRRPFVELKPAFFTGVPTLFAALMNHPDVLKGKADFNIDPDLLLRARPPVDGGNLGSDFELLTGGSHRRGLPR
jgi:hypothetical protein